MKKILNKRKGTRLLDSYLASQLDKEYNKQEGIDLSNLNIIDRVDVWWKCEKHGRFKQKVQYRHHGYKGSCCANEERIRTKLNGKYTRIIETELEPEIDYERNRLEGIDLDLISKSYTKGIYWKCLRGHESFFSSPKHRFYDRTGCPICARHVHKDGERSLAELRPDLVKYYSEDNEYRADEIYANSLKEVHWVCENGHNIVSSPHNVINCSNRNSKIPCPICTHREIITGINDLYTNRKELLEEWDWEKNKDIDPKKISQNSDLKVYWKCKNNSEHMWKTSVRFRVRGNGCPHCARARQTSKQEKMIYFLMKELYPNTTSRGKFNGYEIDVTVPEIKLAIEYDGMAWHSTEEKIKRRLEKSKECEKEGYHFIAVKEYDNLGDDRVAFYKKEDCNLIYFNMKRNYKYLDELAKEIIRYINEVYKTNYVYTDDMYKRAIKNAREWLNSVLPEESLAHRYESLMEDWDFSKNNEIGLDPYSLRPSSEEYANWLCSECGHEWVDSIASRTRGKKCPKYNEHYAVDNPHQLMMKEIEKKLEDKKLSSEEIFDLL